MLKFCIYHGLLDVVTIFGYDTPMSVILVERKRILVISLCNSMPTYRLHKEYHLKVDLIFYLTHCLLE